MGRTARASVGGVCYHVLNRGNGRARVFHTPGDYDAFVALLRESNARLPMRVLAFCLMPNHFHLALWPQKDGDLGRWMQWLTTAHVRRYHRHHRTSGHAWQGRFKAFPVQSDEHLLAVLRYIERNPLRANLVSHAENWKWSSLALAGQEESRKILHPGPVPRPANWTEVVNLPQTDPEVEALRRSVIRGAPFGSRVWTVRTARALGLEYAIRPLGRPKAPSHGRK